MLTPGTRLGPYEIQSPIGVGGMGEVYGATDTNLGRRVAVKVLPEGFASDADRLARFEREARTLAALSHPNIAIVHGLEKAGGVLALVMELVDGPTLAERVAQGAVPVDEALQIAKQLAEALAAAHEQGIVHRDLKPANIKVRPDGTVKVLDFGLAKAVDSAGALSPGLSQSPTITTPAMTQIGTILGTAAYMSPEQARGKSADKRSDIWAFGCVLFEMLAGQRAFPGEDVTDTLAAVVKLEPDWAALGADVPARVRQVLRVCLAKNPARRGGDIAAIQLALEGAFETTAPIAADAPAAAHPVPLWRRALPVAAGLVFGGLLVGLAAWSLRPAAEPAAVARFEFPLLESQQFRNTGRPVLAMSRDGRVVVYNAGEGLYLRRLDELEPRLIAGTEAGLANPFLSPDGREIAFWQSGQLRRQSVDGGTSVVIGSVPNPFGASWEPDGSIFLGQPEGIVRVPASGGTPAVVIPIDAGQAVHGPQLLPDGDSVLFTLATGPGESRWNDAQIVVQSLSSGTRTVVLRGGSDARYIPTGHLVYASADALLAVAFDLETLAPRGAPVPIAQGVLRSGTPEVNTATANYAVSTGGTFVYVPATSTDVRPVWVGREGQVEPLDAVPAGTSPRLSPDGRRLLIEVSGDLWIYELATGRRSRVTREGGQRGAWDSTGTRVAYTSAAGGDEQIYLKPSDGSGEAEQLTSLEGGRVHVDSWSPDGATLAFHQHRQTVDLFMQPMAGAQAEPRVFLDGDFNEADAVFSPDGRYVAYRSTENGRDEIYIRPHPGPGAQTPVSVGGGQQPVWAANGELFYRDLAGERMLSVMVATTPTLTVGAPRELFRGSFFNFPAGGSPRPQYDVTADGRRLLMLEPTGTDRQRIVVVQNYFEELRRLVPVD